MSQLWSNRLKPIGNFLPRLGLLSTLLSILVIVLATGCTGLDATDTPTDTSKAQPFTPTPTPTALPITPTATHTPTPPPTPTATAKPIPTLTATPTPTLEGALPEKLFLEIVEPADESVVNSAVIFVRGQTTPDAVISLDGQTVEVDVQGEFVAEISLEEGPNIIEIVASNLAGMQESTLLSVIYIP